MYVLKKGGITPYWRYLRAEKVNILTFYAHKSVIGVPKMALVSELWVTWPIRSCLPLPACHRYTPIMVGGQKFCQHKVDFTVKK